MKKGILFVENSEFSPNPIIRSLIAQIQEQDENYAISLLNETQLSLRHFTNEIILVDFSLSQQLNQLRAALPATVVLDTFDAVGYATMSSRLILKQIQQLELSFTLTLESVEEKRRQQWFAAVGKGRG